MHTTILNPSDSDVEKNPKVCHIACRNPSVEMFGKSYCGLKNYTPQTEHSWDECLAHHTICVVCIAEFERVHHRPHKRLSK